MKIKQYIQLPHPITIVAFALAFTCLLSGCQPTEECGSWTFNGTLDYTYYGTGFKVTDAFDFTPATCGESCKCDTDAMIQMVSVYDATSETYLFAGTGDAKRAVAYGWTIDRVDGAGEGYYGLLNDGVTFYSGWNTTGSNGTANTLYDEPRGWGPNTYFCAVAVAVCFKSKSCKNRILGYYFWSFTTDNSDTISPFIEAPAWKGLDAEFQSAVAGWNAWAPTSGAETDPVDAITLPNAVPFPTLTDL